MNIEFRELGTWMMNHWTGIVLIVIYLVAMIAFVRGVRKKSSKKVELDFNKPHQGLESNISTEGRIASWAYDEIFILAYLVRHRTVDQVTNSIPSLCTLLGRGENSIKTKLWRLTVGGNGESHINAGLSKLDTKAVADMKRLKQESSRCIVEEFANRRGFNIVWRD